MKKKMVTALLAVSMLAGLSAVNVMAADDDTITVGFSQVGAESDWRTANTESMKSTFSEDNGYELIFDDAQQKQENQLTAIRNFIQQEVDYIVLAPVTETGWDTVLQEAKDAAGKGSIERKLYPGDFVFQNEIDKRIEVHPGNGKLEEDGKIYNF